MAILYPNTVHPKSQDWYNLDWLVENVPVISQALFIVFGGGTKLRYFLIFESTIIFVIMDQIKLEDVWLN